LSTLECFKEVVDPRSNRSNKHNYVVASQSQGVRQAMREIKGVPLIYVTRSVMLLEPISSATVQVRRAEELDKFRDGIRRVGMELKRKREDSDADESHDDNEGQQSGDRAQTFTSRRTMEDSTKEPRKRKKRKYGVKGPNPLSVRKAKKYSRLKG
jgi:U3 small nucleolar RNA-associated protein 23